MWELIIFDTGKQDPIKEILFKTLEECKNYFTLFCQGVVPALVMWKTEEDDGETVHIGKDHNSHFYCAISQME